MRLAKLVLASLIWILVAGFISFMQQDPEEFSDDPAMFVTQLTEYFSNQKNRETQEILKEFITDWQEGKFTLEVQRDVIRISNIMRKVGVRPHMGYTDYLQALSSFTETTGNKSILAWNVAVEPFADLKKTRQLKLFLNNTTQFNLEHILYKQNTTTWKFNGEGFNYHYDTTLYVDLKNINLVCYSSRDSIVITGTSGYYFPLADRFTGHEGKVFWEKFGYNSQRVYAVVDNYNVNLRENAWKADTVNFYHKAYFSEPLVGSLEDRVMAGIPLDKSTYPKFTSYNYDIGIRNLYRDIDYYGGFAIEGSRIVGAGNNNQESSIFIKKGTELLMRINSKSFVIRPDRLVSQRASVTIFHENDSIFHTGLQLRYLEENREVALLRNGEGVSGSPFSSSFHKVDMYFQGLYYSMDADIMTMEMMRGLNTRGEAIFESTSFYSEERFNKLQGIDELNPINVIVSYTEKTKSKTFLLPELVEYMKKPYEQVKAMVINLSDGGFVNYYLDNDRIEVKQKLFDYLNARSKKLDYDVIQISSSVDDGPNGILDLKTFNIIVKGVDSVSLSDRKAVYIYPQNKEIILGPDRDIVFTGKVNAGYFSFFANQSSFEYGKFKLNMPTIDSMSFVVDTIDQSTKKKVRVPVKNVIADLSGELLIDDPANKSGIKDMPAYPLFKSENDAYVYYDDPSIRRGAYKRENFYYTVYPFTLDSLNSFTTEGLKFSGSLHSGDILPDIKEPLRVMEDFALGFTKTLPQSGLPAYDGRATYFSKVRLDNNGLHGEGKLEYLTSTSESPDFVFYPDSLVADLTTFSLKEQSGITSFPEVYAEGVHQHWVPKLDSMRLKTLPGKEFEMFGKKSYHSGELTLTSAGLMGDGKSRLDNADIVSNSFAFKNQSFHTDTTDFLLYYPERPTLSLSTRVNSGSVDFETQHGTFGVTGESQRIELPHSKYVCYMDKIEWSMDESELILTNSLVQRSELADTVDLRQLTDYDFSGSEFISTDPARDSLQFFAMEATYDMKENIINAREVKVIRVADVAIFPGDGKVTILSDGDMQALKGANIIANRKDKHHRIYDADVKVNSRKHYLASGNLDYVDDVGNIQALFMNPITVDESGSTYGVANVPPSKPLPLNDHFSYIGNVKMNAPSKNLYYDGLFRLTSGCLAEDRPWVKFNAELDQTDIRIPISTNLRDSINDPILFGVVYSEFFSSIYPSLFEKPKAFGDTLVAGIDGFIRFDHTTGSYMAGSNTRIDRKSLTGNLLTFSADQCKLTAEGNLNIGASLGSVKLQTFGDVTQFTLVDSTVFNMSQSLEFFFSDQALARLHEDVQTTELGSLDVNSPSFKTFLVSLIGEPASNVFLEELNLSGQVKKMPAELNKPLIFNNVKMVWDPKLKSYVSDGKIGLAIVKGDIVNRSLDGYIEIGKRRTGDVLNIYLELNPLVWYYFSYSNGIMQSISSNNEYNSIISSLNESKRSMKTDDEFGYQFIISTPEARMAFMRKMQQRKTAQAFEESGEQQP